MEKKKSTLFFYARKRGGSYESIDGFSRRKSNGKNVAYDGNSRERIFARYRAASVYIDGVGVIWSIVKKIDTKKRKTVLHVQLGALLIKCVFEKTRAKPSVRRVKKGRARP